MNKKSIYKKLVCQFEAAVNHRLAGEVNPDFNKLEKFILEQKKDNRFYRSIQRFLVYLGEFKNKNDKNFICPVPIKTYRRLLKVIESSLISNQAILEHWKCLEKTYLKCAKTGNFKLLDDKRQEYQYSFNFNKWNALDRFDTSSRISQQENLETRSVFSAMLAAVQQVTSKKLKKNIINLIKKAGQAIWPDVNSSSQNIPNFILILNTGSRWQVLLTNSKILSALFLPSPVVGHPIQTQDRQSCAPVCPHGNYYHMDINEYHEDLKKSDTLKQLFSKGDFLEFEFKDTIFILDSDCVKRYDSVDRSEQSMCRTDYDWLLEALAIAVVEEKLKQLDRNMDCAEEIKHILWGDQHEYNNKKFVIQGPFKRIDVLTLLEDFLDTNPVIKEFRGCYASRDKKKGVTRPSVINPSSLFQTQLRAQTSNPLQVSTRNSTVPINDQEYGWSVSWWILTLVVGISLILFSIMISFIIRCRKNSTSSASASDVKFSVPLINSVSPINLASDNSESVQKIRSQGSSFAGSTESGSINTQVDELFSLWEKIKGTLDTMRHSKKGYEQLMKIKGDIDSYIKAMNLFLDTNPDTKDGKKIELLDLDIRYQLCSIFFERIIDILEGQILDNNEELSKQAEDIKKILMSTHKNYKEPGPIGIRVLREDFFIACENFLNLLGEKISNNQEHSRKKVEEIFFYLIDHIGKILFYEDVWGPFESSNKKIDNKNITEITGQFNLLDGETQEISKKIVDIQDDTLRKKTSSILGPLILNISHLKGKMRERAGYLQGKKQSSKESVPAANSGQSDNLSSTIGYNLVETNTASELIYANLGNSRMIAHRR